MKIERKSGILLHITSLPGPYGIGTLGRNAFNFVDFLVKAKQKIWQILPLGPTGYGDSPYQSFSTFAGNPLLIDFEKLVEKGWLNASELDNAPGNDNYVDFDPSLNSNSNITGSF
jgi:4-alpha-glucanotransferase